MILRQQQQKVELQQQVRLANLQNFRQQQRLRARQQLRDQSQGYFPPQQQTSEQQYEVQDGAAGFQNDAYNFQQLRPLNPYHASQVSEGESFTHDVDQRLAVTNDVGRMAADSLENEFERYADRAEEVGDRFSEDESFDENGSSKFARDGVPRSSLRQRTFWTNDDN